MAKTKIKYISHAGFQITTGSGKILYLDPWFFNPIGGFSLDDVTGATMVLVTHDHSDHVGQAPDIVKKTGGLLVANVETARRLQSDFHIPAEKVCYFGYGMNIGGSLVYEGITVTMTQAFHSTGSGAPCGYIIRALTRFGGYSSALNVPAAQVFAKPGVLSHAEAASIPVAYLTAWQLLVVQGGLREGDTVLIQNAGSGVGLAALDIARHVGARTIGTASAGKHDFLTARGLGHAVDYRTGDWTREVRALTDDRGVELVIDPLGGESFRRSRSVLRPTGRLGMYGVSAASSNQSLRGRMQLARTAALMPLFHPVSLMNANQGAFGVNLGHMWDEGDRLRRWMGQVLEGVGSGWVRPHVDSSYPLADAGRAHEHIEARRSTGKVVLEP